MKPSRRFVKGDRIALAYSPAQAVALQCDGYREEPEAPIETPETPEVEEAPETPAVEETAPAASDAPTAPAE